MSRADALAALRAYWWLLSRLPLFVLGRRRHLWMMALGERFGRLAESLSKRKLYLSLM